MTVQIAPVVLDGSCDFLIKGVSRLRAAVIDKMRPFVECKDIPSSTFKDDEGLLIDSDVARGYFDFTYAGTRVRLTVVAGLVSNEPSAKVICTHEYKVSGNEFSDFLGEFKVDSSGRTNFHEPSGQIHFTHNSADLILALYIAKALENNLRSN